MPAPVVVIAASDLTPSLRERLAGNGELAFFSDTEPIQALQAILEYRPSLIALERLFAATPRGAALINRIKNDAQLAHAEIRVISHAGDYSKTVSPGAGPPPTPASVPVPVPSRPPGHVPAPPAISPESEKPTLDWRGTRRANRYPIRSAVEIQLDGSPAVVVNLSQVGAQVLSATILRPNQKVRVNVPNDDFVMRFRGTVVWAQFELPTATPGPRYRAGIDFADADPSAIEAFCQKNKDAVSA